MDALAGAGVGEGDAVGVEVEGWIGEGEGLGAAESAAREVEGIADDGVSGVPEVDADLVGAAGEGAGFDEGGAVGVAAKDAAFGAGGEDAVVSGAAAGFAGLVGDGGVADEGVVGRMSLNEGEVVFFDFAAHELLLEVSGEVAGAADDGDAGGVGVDAVGGPGLLGMEGLAEEVLQGVALQRSC